MRMSVACCKNISSFSFTQDCRDENYNYFERRIVEDMNREVVVVHFKVNSFNMWK